jgi:hypothetical protein
VEPGNGAAADAMMRQLILEEEMVRDYNSKHVKCKTENVKYV